MLFTKFLSTLLSFGLVSAIPAESQFSKRGVSFAFGRDKVRGLNIGGWLLLEPWITPSIFDKLDPNLGIVDEFTLTQKLGSQRALEILRPHWDTWATFADFKKIKDAGFNTVRIPVGYWSYSLAAGEPYTQGAAVYIDAAIDWSRALGLKIWIDLHGAPRSQNGFDNSGHRTEPPQWGQGDSIRQTLDVLKTITSKYAQKQYQDVVVAIQLLNEPLGPALEFEKIKQFYRDGFFQTRDTSDTPVVLHDAFFPPSRWNGFLTPSDNNAHGVILDHHEYQVFDNGLVALQPWQHRQLVCNNLASYTKNRDKWLVIGEWTGAMTDCAKALNGYGRGARYDGTFPGSRFVGTCANKNDVSQWDESYRNDMRGYIEAQLDAFEAQAEGWIFWNFKTEVAHEWDAFKLLDNGIFPQPLTDRKFGTICAPI